MDNLRNCLWIWLRGSPASPAVSDAVSVHPQTRPGAACSPTPAQPRSLGFGVGNGSFSPFVGDEERVCTNRYTPLRATQLLFFSALVFSCIFCIREKNKEFVKPPILYI